MPYLNVAPLVHGLEGRLALLPPSQLAVALRRGEIDAGLLSVTEALFGEDYDILDGPCVASHGEVYSVILTCRRPLDEVREVRCHDASLTSVNLLRVLLAERGLHPRFETLADVAEAGAHDFVLLIGDPAIRFRQAHPDRLVLDLGLAWRELTGLPFVYAVWVLRREAETSALRRELCAAADRGVRDLENVIRTTPGFDETFRRHYLTSCVSHDLGANEKQGIARFVALLRRHAGRPVFDPRYVRP
ncbi:MAG: menaquinone biosynthesis protein [Verrucomicrobiales bacterium]|nr:menaquinone biosynthesis protein [Verrucomicrobiales bacterium]